MIAPTALATLPLRRWTVAEYHTLAAAGILTSQDRIELLDGHLVTMSAKGRPHIIALRLLAQTFSNALQNQRLIFLQDPIALSPTSEPEPDLTLVQGQELDYLQRHPQPHEIDLIVEVADSTLKTDCEVKSLLYAQAGIAEYWVVDVAQRQVWVFREPDPAGYRSRVIYGPTAQLSPLACPAVNIPIEAILPPLP
ncbi:Uma2 family endonuclease [Prochlorothrix hollandica]|uniref:Putative restriction endonuclease domain-containing protein n=1 Tax=Prochlorothrix hollandica PCC 9006 = CALU 1027 TaxID=317619 RepID=A0A0M2PYL9_PROHO|nr:Uma2 family endonuclease [Prochlorothrix hollandica]KKI99778.1 hypothetical protein PROH_07915 [Prochlorothrix hollandica PCC 9006 = CALU 1027]